MAYRFTYTSCPEPAESPISPCTLLSENDAFDAQQHEALQIHFVVGNHWVASSSFGQQVTVYDSKYSGKLHPSLTHHAQLAHIYRSLQTHEDGDLMLEINVPTVQQQFGSCDCGLFAIAFTLHLAMGDDPQHILFEQSQMRSHLLKCFQTLGVLKSLKDPHITRVVGTPGPHIPRDRGAPCPHITRDMGTGVPKLGGPHFTITPAPRRGQPLCKGQLARPQFVLCLEVLLYRRETARKYM